MDVPSEEEPAPNPEGKGLIGAGGVSLKLAVQ